MVNSFRGMNQNSRLVKAGVVCDVWECAMRRLFVVVGVVCVVAVLGSVSVGASAGPVFTSASVGNPVAPMGAYNNGVPPRLRAT